MFLFWIYAVLSTLLFLYGTEQLSEFGRSKDFHSVLRAGMSLITANLVYSQILSQDCLSATLFSSVSCMLGYMLIAVMFQNQALSTFHVLGGCFSFAAVVCLVSARLMSGAS